MSVTETDDFNVLQFEKKLTGLKDSQESINNCCQWCLSNRQHHKKIVSSWLNVLKRVKVEHRLILFYLANDVIQYSKRRKYEYVESWGTALQKATTLVRDDRVKQKILRIFKIWEDRGVYSEEFIADLCGLISVTPTAPKNDEPHEFQATYVINKIRVCSNLESDTDLKLKKLKELNPKILDTDSYYSSLKDRAHLDDTEKELDNYAKYMEDYINALKTEVKNRITLISVLKQADGQLDTDRKDVKIVANAYKSFGTRVKTVQKKLEELKTTLLSPIPSPDVNAPSPSSDSDIDLPEGQTSVSQTPRETIIPQKTVEIDLTSVQITNANYYNPVPAPTDSGSQFVANGFTSFIGSNLPFTVQNFNTSNLFSTSSTVTNSQTTNSSFGSLSSTLPSINLPPPPPKTEGYSYSADLHSNPLLPPPMPPFGGKEDVNNFANTGSYEGTYGSEQLPDYGPPEFNPNTSYTNESNYPPSYSTAPADSSYDPLSTIFSTETAFEPPIGANPYPPSEEYNPEEELQTWDGDVSWTQPPPLDSADTPESPPPFEKEAYGDPIEYHDNIVNSGAADVDHRVLPTNLGDSDKIIGRGQDVDHRNLISLIGSPATDSNSNPLSNSEVWTTSDRDYRNAANPAFPVGSGDQDYRLPFDIEEQLKLPPPPPPPTNSNVCVISVVPVTNHLKKGNSNFPQDNVESIDMELSDDDVMEDKEGSGQPMQRENLKVVIDGGSIGGPSSAGSNSNIQSIQSPEDFISQSNSQDGVSSFPETDMTMGTMLEPPPPLPELPDDAEENLFLDQMSNDINEFLLNSDEVEENLPEPFWGNNLQTSNDMLSSHLQPPPMFPNMTSLPPPPMVPPPNWMVDSSNSTFQQQQFHNGSQIGREKRGKFINNVRGMRGNRGGFGESRGGFNDHRSDFNDHRGEFNNSRGGFNDGRTNFVENRPGFNSNRSSFNDSRDGFNDNRSFFNDNGHFNNRGAGPNFRGRGRGNQRHPRGNFRGNFRGNRGNY